MNVQQIVEADALKAVWFEGVQSAGVRFAPVDRRRSLTLCYATQGISEFLNSGYDLLLQTSKPGYARLQNSSGLRDSYQLWDGAFACLGPSAAVGKR